MSFEEETLVEELEQVVTTRAFYKRPVFSLTVLTVLIITFVGVGYLMLSQRDLADNLTIPSDDVISAPTGFVNFSSDALVTISASDVELFTAVIIKDAQLQPFLYGLTPSEQSELVNEFIAAFNNALIMGSATDPSLQKSELYRNGALIQGAAAEGDAEAQKAIDEYIRAFEDDLSWSNGNVNSGQLTLAAVALDALGQTEAAESYVERVLSQNSQVTLSKLAKGLSENGLAESPEGASLVAGYTAPDESNESAGESAPAPEMESVPDPFEDPFDTASDEDNTPPEDNSGEQSFGKVHFIPPMVPVRDMEGKIGFSPYNWVLFAQWGSRVLQNHETGDAYRLLSIHEEPFELFGKKLYLLTLQVEHVFVDGSGREAFNIWSISADHLDWNVGDYIDYNGLVELIEFTSTKLTNQ